MLNKYSDSDSDSDSDSVNSCQGHNHFVSLWIIELHYSRFIYE